jgi:hypothetical protein
LAQSFRQSKMRSLYKYRKFYVIFLISVLCVFYSGCGVFGGAVESFSDLVGLEETGTVIAKRAQIRTSYAVVAGDLLEVRRGDRLDVLEETTFEKVRWFRVRANDEDKTEGWIEAQNVILSEVLDKSKKLAEEKRSAQPQATGQLRAASNLRLTPEITDENILLKLEGGSKFEIVDQRYVPKIQDASGETNVREKNPEIEAAKEKDEGEKIEDKYDIWYQVRLDPTQSPAPVGWLFGRQVELQIPADIVFHQQNNRKFVSWQRIDNVVADKIPGTGNDAVTVVKPGDWVVLTRTNQVKAVDGVEPDFDGIIVFGYDKFDQSHYMAYRNNDVWGRLPLIVEGEGDNKSFTVNLRTTAGNVEPRRFTIVKDKARLRIKQPEDITLK